MVDVNFEKGIIETFFHIKEILGILILTKLWKEKWEKKKRFRFVEIILKKEADSDNHHQFRTERERESKKQSVNSDLSPETPRTMGIVNKLWLSSRMLHRRILYSSARSFTTTEGHRPTIVHKRSLDILHDPWFNKVYNLRDFWSDWGLWLKSKTLC